MGHWEQIGEDNRKSRRQPRRVDWLSVLAPIGALVLWFVVLSRLW